MSKVSIRNFQSIKKAEFSIEGFTVVVGKNNIGKSAIVRAIDAALSNQTGKDFIRNGEKTSEVSIQHGTLSVDWKKGDTATYRINGEPFTKLGRAVPQPILDAGFGKLEVGDQKINPLIASQFEPLFLLDKPGSAVTEALSRLYKLNVLSSADDSCQKELKSAKSNLKAKEADLGVLKEQLDGFKNFEGIKKEVEHIGRLDTKCSELRVQIEDITKFESRLLESANRIKSLKRVEGVSVPDIKEQETGIAELQWIQNRHNELLRSANSVKKLKPAAEISIPDTVEAEGIFSSAQQILSWEASVTSVGTRLKKQQEAIQSTDLASILDIIENVEGYLKDLEAGESFLAQATTTRETRDELKVVMGELQKSQEEQSAFKICPTCERPF